VGGVAGPFVAVTGLPSYSYPDDAPHTTPRGNLTFVNLVGQSRRGSGRRAKRKPELDLTAFCRQPSHGAQPRGSHPERQSRKLVSQRQHQTHTSSKRFSAANSLRLGPRTPERKTLLGFNSFFISFFGIHFFWGRGFYNRPGSAARPPPENRGPGSRGLRARAHGAHVPAAGATASPAP
jgi:hypothetical protein